jgi:hypothetical protein
MGNSLSLSAPVDGGIYQGNAHFLLDFSDVYMYLALVKV